MYAIQNIKTGKFVYGTDYRYRRSGKKHNQRTSGKDYRIVVLKTVEVKRVIEFDMPDRYKTYWERVKEEGE